MAAGGQISGVTHEAVDWERAVHVRHQVQHRLSGAEVEVLVRDYLEGSTIKELAGRFRIHRSTVMELLEKSNH
jgi:hypothetical protein